jgi:hypothetical protein
LTDTGASFLTSVVVGDLVVSSPSDDPVSAYVVRVVDNENLLLSADLGCDASAYDIMRGAQAVLRPAQGVEWTLHTISFALGDSVYPAGLWWGDGERVTLIDDFRTWWLRRGVAEADLYKLPPGFVVSGQNIKLDYNQFLLIRSFVLASNDVLVQGIDKTVSTVG